MFVCRCVCRVQVCVRVCAGVCRCGCVGVHMSQCVLKLGELCFSLVSAPAHTSVCVCVQSTTLGCVTVLRVRGV